MVYVLTPSYHRMGPLFSQYVATRRPCVLTGLPSDDNFGSWDLDYLKTVAGESLVQVESREVGRPALLIACLVATGADALLPPTHPHSLFRRD